MALEFEECVRKWGLVKVPPDREIAKAELDEASSDLKSARQDLDRKDWKWATDKSYYAMFHAARCLLFLKGYKEKSHACLIIGIRELYVKEGVLEQRFLDILISGKKRREDAIYSATYSREIAEVHAQAASELLAKTAEILKEFNNS